MAFGGARFPLPRPGSLPGLAVAVTSLCLSLTPSLLPRTWQVQGIVSGVSAALGYTVGVFVGWVGARLLPIGRRPVPRRAWQLLAALSAALIGVSLYYGSQWQRDIYRLMGERPPGRYTYLGVLALSAALFIAVVAAARAFRASVRLVVRSLGRWVPAALARVMGLAAVPVLVAGLAHGVVHDGLLGVAEDTSASLNNAYPPGVSVPISTLRSGGPGSLVTWQSLGMQGRAFVSGGPSAEQLSAFSGEPAKQPIRAYVGLDGRPGLHDEAAVAVRELQRTSAFSRKVLSVVTTTGTGWIDPYAADALEYLYNGDTAIVGMQYSYLPSWISFLTERSRVAEAGRELFEQVYAVWSALPEGRRPKLLVFGESLGTFGSEAAFSSVDDVRTRADGALWIGPTNANSLWARLTADRDPGSPQIVPTYRHGRTVRFAADTSDLEQPAGAWSVPRVVYLQHASDPVVWWSPRLLLRRPDWLAEPRGPDVLPAMRWYPFVTFFQLTADLALAKDAPSGHGHDYRSTIVPAWVAVAVPDGWTAARTARLIALLRDSHAGSAFS